jgi:hypothetical protein
VGTGYQNYAAARTCEQVGFEMMYTLGCNDQDLATGA